MIYWGKIGNYERDQHYWGYSYRICDRAVPLRVCSAHGGYSSLHHHTILDNIVQVIEGTVEIRIYHERLPAVYIDEYRNARPQDFDEVYNAVLNPGDSYSIQTYVPHRLVFPGKAVFLESYMPQCLIDWSNVSYQMLEEQIRVSPLPEEDTHRVDLGASCPFQK